MKKLKKYYKLFLICFISCIFVLATKCPVSAIESTTYTYTLAPEGYFVRTQDAYMPAGVFLLELELKSPEDIFISDRTLYIADSGNGRIVKYDMDLGTAEILAEGKLSYPTGICVDKNGIIYVADFGSSVIHILSQTGDVIFTIERPSNQLYGNKSFFKPKKISVDSYGNIYVVSEGTSEGILQFDSNKNFSGFFGANQTGQLTLMEWIKDRFFTEEQKAQIFFRTPPNIVSIDIASDDLIYSVTQLSRRRAIKKLNLAGIDILYYSGYLAGENNFVDVAVTPNGEIFAVTDTGSISEFDSDGVLIFSFGGRAVSSERNGLTSVVSAIDVDNEYNIYLLDKERGIIQTYYPTEFAMTNHDAITAYYKGNYNESRDIWLNLLKQNPMSSLAHSGYGKTLFQLGKFEESLEHFRLIYDMDGYSSSFWEIRSEWIGNNLYLILVIFILLFIILQFIRIINKKTKVFHGLTQGFKEIKQENKIFSDLLFVFHVIRHPIDSMYDLKHNNKGSLVSASILYGLTFIVWIMDSIYRAFIFNNFKFGPWANPVIVSVIAVVPIFLYVVGNYLISSINDGEGTFKNVYTAVAYAFSAYIVFIPLITLISYVLTLNEEFLIILGGIIITAYTCVLIFIAAKEIHAYTVGKTIKNIILTLSFIFLAIIAVVILYMLWGELIDFIKDILEEVKYRVFS